MQSFDEISQVISKYEAFVEKFAGDAVMALFGATEAHEDDPVRAIEAARKISEAEVSSTIQGVIAGRLDRLEKESKRILQEASVIGRTFFYEILNRVTDLKNK